MYIAESATIHPTEGRYTFYHLVDKETADGSIVQVKEAIGNYSLQELNDQKDSLTAQLAEVENKIEKINSLNL